MPKQRVDLRVDGDLLAWADDYARRMRWTRTTVFEAALEALRGDARGGVPDLPAAVASRADQEERSVPLPDGPREWAMERQRKLNEAKERRG